MSLSTDDYVVHLRSRVRLEELHSELTPERVLATSRRKRRAHRAGRASVGLTVAALIVGAVMTLAGPRWGGPDVRPAGQEVRAVTVGLAPGVRAVVRPGERVLADGTTAVVLGLAAADASATGTELAVVPNDGANAHVFPEAPWLDTTLDIALLDGNAISQRAYWDRLVNVAPLTEREAEFWTQGGAPEPSLYDPRLIGGTPPELAPGQGWAMGMVHDDGTWMIVGFAPVGTAPDAEANVTLREPLPGEDGAPLRVLRLPTFEVGSADGRRMFAATVAPGVGPGQPSAEGGPTLLERVPVRFTNR